MPVTAPLSLILYDNLLLSDLTNQLRGQGGYVRIYGPVFGGHRVKLP